MYEVQLESPTDGQRRYVTLNAESEDAARARALELEAEYVAYELDVTTLSNQLTDEDRDRVRNTCEFREDGKVVGGRARDRARLHMDAQVEPYGIVDVREFSPVTALVDLAKAQSEDPEAWAATLQALRDAGVPLAAVTGSLYGLTTKAQVQGTGTSFPVVWTSDTIKVSLHTNSYSPNNDTDDYWNDATNEVSGTGYTTGGATLGSTAATYDTATDQARLDAADSTWSSSTITARKAVVYKSTGTSSTSPVVGWLDFGADVSTTSGTFTITWDSTGIVVYDVT